MTHARFLLVAVSALSGCVGGASARLELANQTVDTAARSSVLADGTSLRLKLIAAYLAEDVDPMTMNNIGQTAMIWLNPECNDDIGGCNVAGFALPAGGPRVTRYFDLARPSAEVNADLNSQAMPIEPGTYRYARVEMCKAYTGDTPTPIPTLMWRAPGMTAEQPFSSNDCGRTSLAFDPPLVLATGDAVAVSLGYDLANAVASGPPHPASPHCSYAIAGHNDPGGGPHCFRTCIDLGSDTKACMDFPELAPSATRL